MSRDAGGVSPAREALSPILERWKGLRALPDLSVADQYLYAEEVGTLTLWLHSNDLVRELVGDDGQPLDDLLFFLGRSMLRLGDPAGASDLFSRSAGAIQAGPRRLAAVRHLNALGNCWIDLERHDLSEDAFRRAMALLVALDPGDLKMAVLQNNLATVLGLVGRFEEAEHYFLESLRTIEAASDEEIDRGLGSLEARVTRHDLVGGRIHNLGELHLQRAKEADGPTEARRVRIEADRRFEEALRYFERRDFRLHSELHRVEVAILDGRAPEADATLARLELEILEDRGLHSLLPGLYRRRAEASRAVDALGDALRHCRRALTSSLVHGHRLEERLVVDTFLDTLAEVHRRDDPNLDAADPRAAAELARVFARRYGDLVDDLVGFLEHKDWYTGRAHSKGVVAVARRVGEAILADHPGADIDLEVLSFAGLLHDIGKLHVPWALLNKILPVRRDELVVLKSHAIEGYNILTRLGLGPLATISAEHHERVDGRGYPFARERPSLMGNVLALADTFEAMTTINRRWRPAKKKREAIPELADLEGSCFYPEVVAGMKKGFS